jgi:hypothetical protein
MYIAEMYFLVLKVAGWIILFFHMVNFCGKQCDIPLSSPLFKHFYKCVTLEFLQYAGWHLIIFKVWFSIFQLK